ncbi:hypothetical protein N9Y37_01915 [Luminiphilus sp.]|nr:hypothetical protein [Luminiphilus sp.]
MNGYLMRLRSNLLTSSFIPAQLSVALLSLTTTIAISIYFIGAPSRLFSFTATILALSLVSYYWRTLHREQGPISIYDVCIIPFCVFASLITYGNQFAYTSLWGDIGVYVNVASHFLAGGHIPFSIDAVGIDLSSNTPINAPLGMINPATEPNQFQFHGLPTWPGFMALFDLGVNGRAILSLLLGFSGYLFYHSAKAFSENDLVSFLIGILFLSLPIVWHQALYATAEMLLLTIVLATLVLVIHLKNGAIYSFIGIFAYGSTHTGALLVAPAIGAVLVASSLFSRSNQDRLFAITGILCAGAAFLAYSYALAVSTKYSVDISRGVFGSIALCYLMCALPLVALTPYCWRLCSSRSYEALSNFARTHFKHAALIFLIIAAISLFIKSYWLGWTTHYLPDAHDHYNSWSARAAYVDKGLISLTHLSFLNLALASGLLGLGAFLFAPFKGFSFDRNKLLWAFTAIFVFLFGIYRVDIPNNYYSSRYFVPLLVPGLLLMLTAMKMSPRILFPLVFLAIAVATPFNAANVGKGFFTGEYELQHFLNQNLADKNSQMFLLGGDWLKFLVYPGHLERNARKPTSKDGNHAYLISDSTDSIVGGTKLCHRYIERRIPWKIAYPTEPEKIPRSVCIYQAESTLARTLELTGNSWTVNGRLEFFAVRPKHTSNAQITFNSLGWWNNNNRIEKLEPSLEVCGEKFRLAELSPLRIVFEGPFRSVFCKASLSTATFVPKENGEGSDASRLGVDIYSINLKPR